MLSRYRPPVPFRPPLGTAGRTSLDIYHGVREMAARDMTPDGVRAALVELCDEGLLTCTSGNPGEAGSTYAVAWLPLNDPDSYPESVRRRHAQNMYNLTQSQSDQL